MFKFGTSGIRDLTINLLKDHVAAQLAKHLCQQGWQAITIGRDGRAGSEDLAKEFKQNFTGNITDLGITTTPELAAQAGLAVMVTASHNPSEYCGFKLYLHHQEQNTADVKPTPVYDKFAQLPKDIVIDCANGGLGHKLQTLGFTNIINAQGEINRDCGATHPENITQYCQDNHLEIGFAVDGDADRFLMYLNGRVLPSEDVTYLIAKLLKLERIVVDETVNTALGRHFDIVQSKVGGHAVIAAMRANNITFGAEKSGHYYFDKNISISDALDAIILLTNGYRTYGAVGLEKMLTKYRPYYQFYKNVDITSLPQDFAAIIDNYILPKGVRKVIRKSGTEPLLRIMLEGKNEKAVMKAWQKLATQLQINF